MSAIDRLSPSQQLELVQQRQDEGLSYRELERFCLDRYQVEISYQTIKNYFDNALATMPRDIRDLKAMAILGLAEHIGTYNAILKDDAQQLDLKTRLQIMLDKTKLLLGVAAIKPDMPMPTSANTPGEVSITEKRLRMKWGSPVETAAEAEAHSAKVVDAEGSALDDR